MSDVEISPEQQEHNRRLFGSMIGWLLLSNRRPGMVGEAVSFRGRMRSGQARLNRLNGGWELVTPAERRELMTADVLRLVAMGGFFPRTVDVVPDLADVLFQEAVHQAEESVRKVSEAARHTQELMERDPTTDLAPWILATSALDRAVRASIASIVLAIAAAEAQVNQWAYESNGWKGREDRLAVERKCQVLAKRAGHLVNLGQHPYQELHRMAQRRNAFLHSKPVPQSLPLTGARSPVPGSSISIEARETCVAVRSTLVDLARRIVAPSPSHLAYCPPGAANDDAAWSSASLMTGTRPDPDFPTVASRTEE